MNTSYTKQHTSWRARLRASAWRRVVAVTVFAAAPCGCGNGHEPPAPGGRQVARSPHGMVASASPVASRVGAEILEGGGNAVDAAVAAAFALGVVEPTMSGLGGRTQMLVRTRDGAFYGIDGGAQVPASYHPTSAEPSDTAYGYGTVGIPGTVAALAAVLEAHGTLSLAQVMEPAIALADSGFPMPEWDAGYLAETAPRLQEFVGSRRHFLRPDGSPYQPGDRFVQPVLARTLRAIARDGPDVFYRGWIADSIAADMAAHGGFVTRQDLAAYRVADSRIVRGSYHGYDVVGTYLPASGATTIEILQILENFDLGALPPAEWGGVVAQALLLGFEDRVADLGPPEAHADSLVSRTWASRRAQAIRSAVGALEEPAVREPAHTTHLSVADGEGGVVALTQSLGPAAGSKVATRELGFLYAATMEYLSVREPGARPWSSQSPLVLLREGRPAFVLGGAGARRIISALVEVVSRTLDRGLDFADAVGAPRMHPSGNTLYVEVRDGAAWSQAERDGLAEFGFEISERDRAAYFARLHGIAVDTLTGDYVGVADPRGSGSAAAVRR
jgi:gamma-glutamyltranspeptidase/glutathione hydrolase